MGLSAALFHLAYCLVYVGKKLRTHELSMVYGHIGEMQLKLCEW